MPERDAKWLYDLLHRLLCKGEITVNDARAIAGLRPLPGTRERVAKAAGDLGWREWIGVAPKPWVGYVIHGQHPTHLPIYGELHGAIAGLWMNRAGS